MQPLLKRAADRPVHHAFHIKRLALVFILVTALLLRLYRIDQPYTDMASWRQTSVAMMADNFYHRNPNIFFPEVSWHGPGESYNGRELQTISYTATLLYYITGQHEWVGRLVAVLFGVWGVFALYQLVRRVWDEKRGLASAATMALLPGAVFIDRCFLPDPAMVSLVTTALWLMVAYLQTDRTRYLVLATLTGCIGFLTKITGMLVLLPMLYAIITIYKARNKLILPNIIKILIPGLIAVTVVAIYYLWARYLSEHYPPYHFAGTGNWLWEDGLRSWIKDSYFSYQLEYIFKFWTLGKPFIALFFAGIITAFMYAVRIGKGQRTSESPHYGAPYFFHFYLAGCLFFYFIGAKELVDNFWNFHIFHPMIAGFCGSAMVFIWQTFAKYRPLQVAAMVFVFACIGYFNTKVLRNTAVDPVAVIDYKMGKELSRLKKEGDLVVVLSQNTGNPLAIFYSKGRGWVFPPAGRHAWDVLPETEAECIIILEDLRSKGADWFAINREQYKTLQTRYPKFERHLTSSYPLRAAQPDFVIFQLLPGTK
jgi:hypothetical protein